MRRMKLSRLGVGTSLGVLALLGSLVSMQGACTTNGDEACGNNGVKNGICQVGPTCPSGSVEILISDPSDECPGSNGAGGESYICCNSNPGTGSGASDSGTTAPSDSGANPG